MNGKFSDDRHASIVGVMAQRLDQVEQWFVRRGVPHFIVGYDATTDIWTRALPLLVAAYVVVGMNALDVREWSLAKNLAVAAAVVAVLVVTWLVANVARGRPWRERPRAIGPVELVIFVIGPALPALIVGQPGDAFEAVAWSLAALVVAYFATSYGAIPLLQWAFHTARQQALAFINVLLRVLPLLLMFITFLFINAEVWQLAGGLYGWPYVVVILLFVALGALFLLSRTPAIMHDLADFADWSDIVRLVAATPADTLNIPTSGQAPPSDLGRREKLNIGLVTIVSQGIQITFVAMAVFVFFVAFGVLAVSLDTTAAWTGLSDVHVFMHIGDRPFVVTDPLLRVAGFLATFTGMYFTVVASTDATYRDQVTEDVGPRVRQALAVRTAYRWTNQPDVTNPTFKE